MPPRGRSALVARLEVDQPGRPQPAILDELRRVILDGAVPPGTPIPLAEVANLFGVSQIPVRESLKTLIGCGVAFALYYVLATRSRLAVPVTP
jgi:DNA-binding GntR family transcriptional regulator